MKAEQIAAVNELNERRLDAFRSTSGTGMDHSEVRRVIAESTTQADIDTLNDIVRSQDSETQALIRLYEDVWREFGRYRCSVCGRTAAQNRAIDYDCITEC